MDWATLAVGFCTVELGMFGLGNLKGVRDWAWFLDGLIDDESSVCLQVWRSMGKASGIVESTLDQWLCCMLVGLLIDCAMLINVHETCFYVFMHAQLNRSKIIV